MKKPPANALGITPRRARTILKNDLDRVVKAANKSKQPLPCGVRKMIAQLCIDDPEEGETPLTTQAFADNKRQLGRLIGCSHWTLDRWFKEQGCPKPTTDGRHDVAAWKTFARAKGFTPAAKNGEVWELSAKDKAVIARLETRLARERMELAVLQRGYVSRDEVNAAIAKANTIVIRELVKVFEHELPPMLEGMKAAEAQALISDKLREVLTKLPQALQKVAGNQSKNGHGAS